MKTLTLGENFFKKLQLLLDKKNVLWYNTDGVRRHGGDGEGDGSVSANKKRRDIRLF